MTAGRREVSNLYIYIYVTFKVDFLNEAMKRGEGKRIFTSQQVKYYFFKAMKKISKETVSDMAKASMKRNLCLSISNAEKKHVCIAGVI